MPSAICSRCGAPLGEPTHGESRCESCRVAETGDSGFAQADTALAGSVRTKGAVPLGTGTTPAPPEAAEAPETSRYGRYVCTQKLGSGGMGEVWKAWDSGVGRWVALKFLKGSDDEEVVRFRREAQLAGQLSHPNIAAIYEVGEARGRHYIAMQHVEGETLRKFGSRDPRFTARLIRDAARAVAYAHELGIVHRDLKPDNLMITLRGAHATSAAPGSQAGAARTESSRAMESHVYVMDFGLARMADGASGLTLSGAVVGTPAYMPPEQARGERVDARADVYSLGATLYELLTGRPPFSGGTALEVMINVEGTEAVPPRKLVSKLDAEMETIVLKCLEKDRMRRYAGAAELAEDLDRWLRGDSILARRQSTGYRLRKWLRRHRGQLAIAGATAVIVVAAAASWGPVNRWRAGRRAAAERSDRLSRSSDGLRRAAAALDAHRNEEAFREVEALLASCRADEAHPVAQAHFIAARAALALGRDAAVLLGRAYIAASSSDSDPERAAAAAAMLLLSKLRAEAGAWGEARAACEIVIARFPRSPEAGEARRRRAEALDRLGELDGALLEYEAIPGSEPAAAALRAIRPTASAAIPAGALSAGDLDGDGRDELVLHEDGGALAVYRVRGGAVERLARAAFAVPPGERAVPSAVADLDADGRPEMLLSRGSTDLATGNLDVWRWDGASLKKLASAPMGSCVSSIRVADLDGDGRVEILACVDYYVRRLRVLHFDESAGLSVVTEHIFGNPRNGADPLDALPADFLPEPGLEILAASGPWSDWRLSLLSWDGTAFRQHSVFAKRLTASKLSRLADGRVVFKNGWVPNERKALVENGKVPEADLLPNGWYEIRVGPDGTLPEPRLIAAPEAEPGTPWQIHGSASFFPVTLGESDSLVLVEGAYCDNGEYRGRARLVPLDGRDHSRILDSASVTIYALRAELDGDPEPEIVTFAGEGGRQILRFFGWNWEGAPPPNPAAQQSPAIGRDVPGEVAAAGLADLALTLYAEKGDRLRGGLTLMEREDWEGAASLFREADAAQRPEAVRHLARCYERSMKWDKLVEILPELALDAHRSPLEIQDVRRQEAWARAAVAVPLRARLRCPLDHSSFLSENPILVARATDGLEVRHTIVEQTLQTLPLAYGGGPIRFEWDFRIVQIAWAGCFALGLQGDSELVMQFSSYGSKGASVCSLVLGWGRGPRILSADLFRPNFVPRQGAWYHATLEYVPGFERARLAVTDGESRTEASLDLPSPLEPGDWNFGRVSRRGFLGSQEEATVLEIRDVQLFASDPSTGFADPVPESARDLFLAANGDFARGDSTRAFQRWELALARCGPTDASLRARIQFFRGIARLRAGTHDAARADFRAAAETDARTFERVLQVSESFLAKEEAQAVKTAVPGK